MRDPVDIAGNLQPGLHGNRVALVGSTRCPSTRDNGVLGDDVDLSQEDDKAYR